MIEPFTCSTFGRQCPIKISGNCINIPSCCTHIAFIRSLMWLALTGHFDNWQENEVYYLCLTRIFTTDQKIFIPRSMPSVESIMASLRGVDLCPLSGSLRKLLDIGNAIHLKHWNPDLALSLHPKHCLNKTFSYFNWLRFVAIFFFFKKGFSKIRSKHKCSNQNIKISNHENLCFKAHASSKSGKSMPKPLLWEKCCLSKVVVPYQG